jgi:hypothetical protein
VKILDATFQSCADLQELFQPVSPDLSALQLSQGTSQGRLQIINLGSFLWTSASFMHPSTKQKPNLRASKKW